MKNPVQAVIYPKRKWGRDGWAYEVSTYGETHWGNGVVGWCRSRDKAQRLAREYKADIEYEFYERRAEREAKFASAEAIGGD